MFEDLVQDPPGKELFRLLWALERQEYRSNLMQDPIGEPLRGPRGGPSMKGLSLWTNSRSLEVPTLNRFDFDDSRLWRISMQVELDGEPDMEQLSSIWQQIVDKIQRHIGQPSIECSAGPPDVLLALWEYGHIPVVCEAVLAGTDSRIEVVMQRARSPKEPVLTLCDVFSD